jgi:hypothetical protein
MGENRISMVNTMTALAELLRTAAPIVDPARAVAIAAEMLAPSRRGKARLALLKMLIVLDSVDAPDASITREVSHVAG